LQTKFYKSIFVPLAVIQSVDIDREKNWRNCKNILWCLHAEDSELFFCKIVSRSF
jgi:hypothetical protein